MSKVFLFVFSFFVLGQSSVAQAEKIQIWHQMIYSAREVLAEAVRKYEIQNPEIQIELVYKETEELRSSFQAAAMGGSGPDLIYGPSDQVGPFVTMGIIQPLQGIYTDEELKNFDPLSLVQYQNQHYMMGDVVGNHLSLIYNKKLVPVPPKNTKELIEIAQRNTNQKAGRFGLAWHMFEPFFFVPWVRGFGTSFVTAEAQPQLDSEAMIKAFALMRLFKKLKITPEGSDYEIANALFKEGKAAMIINGDWSWGDYLQAKIDFGIAPIPMVSETGLWPAPLVSTKGYSINVNVSENKKAPLHQLLKYLLSDEVQLMFTKKLSSLPSSLSARKNELVVQNELLKASSEILKHGELMPVNPELRAVWDALRPEYQAVLAGTKDEVHAARDAQKNALQQIQNMNVKIQPNWQAILVWIFFVGMIGFCIYHLPNFLKTILQEFSGPRRFAYWMMLPGYLALAGVIFYPFVYNVVLSFSNLSLRTFQDWQVVGFQNYLQVLKEHQFYSLLWKSILWTLVNVVFHVSIGVFLAVLIDQTLPAKKLFRVLLMIPWAVPQYITALTWRGLFNQEYGSINVVLKNILHMDPVQWLSKPFEAFTACILTNIWLGFPFMMVVSLAGLQVIPKELYEAAKMDGASAWQRFWNITWPLLQPVLIPATVLGAIWTFNNFNVVWLVSNGGEPSDQTHILVSYVYKSVFNLYQYSQGAALSMLIFLLLLVFSILFLQKNKASWAGEEK